MSTVITPEVVPSLPPSVVLSDDLNNRQKLFVTYYLEHRNATKAARLAGYEGDDVVLAITGSRLLRHTKVIESIESYFQSRILSSNGVLSELSDIAFAPLAEMEARQGENGLIPAVLKPSDKIKSLELLGKFHKLFADNASVELSLNESDSLRMAEQFASALIAAAEKRRQQVTAVTDDNNLLKP